MGFGSRKRTILGLLSVAVVAGASQSRAAVVTSISDAFTGSSVDTTKWNETDKGIQLGNDTAISPTSYSNAGGYNQPSESASGLLLGGTTDVPSGQFWYGDSLESVNQLSTTSPETVTVTRNSLTGTGSAYRSSLWIYQDSTHYLHFAQDVGELGWQYNYDDNGAGVPIGSGTAISAFSTLNTTGSHVMSLAYVPGNGTTGPTISIYLDGALGTTQSFTSPWTSAGFTVILTGQARATNDTVAATFSNLTASPTPEPAASALLGLGALGLLGRRRRAPRK